MRQPSPPTFLINRHIFQKRSFPRMIVPLSQITVNVLNFAAQFGVLLCIIGFYNLTGTHIELSSRIIFVPLILLCLTTFALGLGCLIASWTVRYRDLNMLVGYGLQLWMYVSCVVFPESIVPANLRWLVDFNPMAMLILAIRSCLFGVEHYVLSIPALVVLVVIAIGLVVRQNGAQLHRHGLMSIVIEAQNLSKRFFWANATGRPFSRNGPRLARMPYPFCFSGKRQIRSTLFGGNSGPCGTCHSKCLNRGKR